MALFKKKKPREIKEDDSTFVKLWYNPRSHALIVLGLYFLFFLILIIFLNISDNKTSKSNNLKGSNINDLFLNLEKKEITYDYIIKTGKKNYLFNGKKYNDSITGLLTFNGENINIKVDNDKCIVGTYDEDEFKPQYSLCPDDINYTYFDYKNIYNLIKNVEIRNNQQGYYSVHVNKDINMNIFYKDKNINKIVIRDKNSEYELVYLETEEENINSEDSSPSEE